MGVFWCYSIEPVWFRVYGDRELLLATERAGIVNIPHPRARPATGAWRWWSTRFAAKATIMPTGATRGWGIEGEGEKVSGEWC